MGCCLRWGRGREGRGAHLEFYPFPSRAGADLDDFAGEFDADGLGREDTPLTLDEAVEETGSGRGGVSTYVEMRGGSVHTFLSRLARGE